jgi:hypothetical protein
MMSWVILFLSRILDGNEGPTYCVDDILNSEDPTKFDSCFVNDGTCDADVVCEVCDGDQTVSIIPSNNACYDVDIITCADEYMRPFLHEYNVGNPIKVGVDEPVEHAPRQALPRTSFARICPKLKGRFQENSLIFFKESPKWSECECVPLDPTAPAFALSCETTTFPLELEGVLLVVLAYQNAEMTTFEEQNGYLVTRQVQWCESDTSNPSSDEYCQNFEFTFLQNQFSICDSHRWLRGEILRALCGRH